MRSILVFFACVTCLVRVAEAQNISARLVLMVNTGLTAEAAIELDGPGQLDNSQTFFIIVPFTSFDLAAQTDDVIAMAAKDSEKQSIICVFVPKETTLPITIAGSMTILPRSKEELGETLAEETSSYLYRTSQGVGDQITLQLAPPRPSQFTKVIGNSLLELSSVDLVFPEDTNFVSGARPPEGFKAKADAPHWYVYNVEKMAGRYGIVKYQLKRASETTGLLVSILVAFFGLAPAGMEQFAEKRTRAKMILYGLVLILAIGAGVYFYFFDVGYVLANKKDFVAPGVAVVVIFILFIRGLYQALRGSRAAATSTDS